MNSRFQNLKIVTGMVTEVNDHKAILAFGYDGKQEQAVLKKEKLTLSGRHLRDELLPDVLPIGTVVKFWCHRIPERKLEECAWFATHAFKQHSYHDFVGMLNPSSHSDRAVEFMPGLHRIPGTICEVTDRYGIIVSKCTDSAGERAEIPSIFFTISKLVVFGKPVTQNQKLSDVIQEGDSVYFDAIPIYPQENFKSCKWFATIVWKGQRPVIQNALAIPKEVGLKNLLTNEENLQSMLYQVASDTNAMFLKTEARVMFLINSDFGVAMLLIKENVMMSALFHNSVCYFFGHNLKNCDLQKFLKEGDHIKFVGVEAPPGLISKFVATHIFIGKPETVRL